MFERGKINNGVPKYGEYMDRLTAVVPSPLQLKYLELEHYNFIHFGVNTFTDREWGDGTESEKIFNPELLDTDQWCEALKASGSKGIILTAKHHDGFCLWQTKYTEHCVRNSGWRNGKGDVLADLAKSCESYGMKLGVYLSPWDRNNPIYGDNKYNDYFVNQLTELLTGYGELFSVWFDGARGEGVNMKPDFKYDFNRWYSLIRKYQPNAAITIMGPDVRWVGNEGGISRESEWSIVADGEADPEKIAELSQKNPEMAEDMKNHRGDMSRDLGSRELLSAYGKYRFYPAEVDVSIHNGWFYHDNEQPKELEHLLKIFYTGVGGNSSLLLNIPPDRRGLIADRDVARLKEFGDAVRADRSRPIAYKATAGSDESFSGREIPEIYTENTDSYAFGKGEYLVKFDLEKESEIKFFDIREDLTQSQRVELFDIYAVTEKGIEKAAEAKNIGNRRIVRFDKPVKTKTLIVEFVQSRKDPVIRSVKLYG